jgi:hypothetical protein
VTGQSGIGGLAVSRQLDAERPNLQIANNHPDRITFFGYQQSICHETAIPRAVGLVNLRACPEMSAGMPDRTLWRAASGTKSA